MKKIFSYGKSLSLSLSLSLSPFLFLSLPLSLSHFLPPCHSLLLSLLLFYFVGYLGYAGSGKNSRGTQLIMAFQDNKYLGGAFLIYSFERFPQRSQNLSFFTSSLSFLFSLLHLSSYRPFSSFFFFFLFSISYLLAPSPHILLSSLLFSSLLFSSLLFSSRHLRPHLSYLFFLIFAFVLCRWMSLGNSFRPASRRKII